MDRFYVAAVTLISYNPDTGKLTWLPRPVRHGPDKTWNSRFAGSECGKYKDSGHIVVRITIDKVSKTLPAHRLAWYLHTGEIPKGVIDHINRIPTDNRISNLRDVSNTLNSRNATLSSANKSGVCGVRKRGDASYEAYGTLGTKYIYLGVYNNPDDASIAAKNYRNSNEYTTSHGT